MRHRRSNANAVSAKLVDYLVTRRGLAQGEIADVLEVDKSFISRVRKAERDFSSEQLARLADHLNVPMGAMLIAALKPDTKPVHADRRALLDLCERLMLQADQVVAAARTERAQRATKKAS